MSMVILTIFKWNPGELPDQKWSLKRHGRTLRGNGSDPV
jgi:hypothetical protein